jgi:hypothetical protein
MKVWLLFLTLPFLTEQLPAQQLAVPDLFDMLGWPHMRVDTTLKKKGYMLMQKEVDSSSAIYQYSHLDRRAAQPVTIRSLVYMDVTAGEVTSRLITYRTYSEEEFVKIASWLLENGWRTKEKFDFGESKHTLYTDGNRTIRMKITHTKLKNGKLVSSYELELGK